MKELHRYRHNTTAIDLGNPFWEEAKKNGLIEIAIERQKNGQISAPNGHEFVNMISLSYLGLDEHPLVIKGAILALEKTLSMREAVSRLRIHNFQLRDLEESLSDLFQCRATSVLSCSVGSAAILPLLASGHLTDGVAPVMLFDRFCHFSMNFIKPICADETEVLTCPHNDLNFIEDICRKNKRVAYVADGVYSMGGKSPIDGLMQLQDRYGLYLFFDESHSLSVVGKYGEGYIRSSISDLNSNICIVASLSKGFGSTGGIVMLGSSSQEEIIRRFGGPVSWSQSVNVATIGATLASAKIHKSEELFVRQEQLKKNITLFDKFISTPQQGNNQQIRVVKVPNESIAVEISKKIYNEGFYVSAVFFPIVPKGTAAIRIILRANHTSKDIIRFCSVLMSIAKEYGIDIKKGDF